MLPDFDICYRALSARDPRFDGAFFVGVRSTGIYCRSICSARTPLAASCRFFPLAAAAETAGFRPCLRCRPEIAPGNPRETFPEALLEHVRGSAEVENLYEVARKSGVSSRQMRRVLVESFGVTPVQIRQTERLLLAKRLLQETRLPVIEIGAAAGFQSLRRFNTLFKKRYHLSPSRFRKEAGAPSTQDDLLTFRLAYRPPFAWSEILAFLARRAIPGVELVDTQSYSRVVSFDQISDVIKVTAAAQADSLVLALPPTLIAYLSPIMNRLHALFDLDANPQTISETLSSDPFLQGQILKNPGLRVPGAWCSYELAVRAILGQQISVAGATTLAGRLVQRFGKANMASQPSLDRVFFSAETLAGAPLEEIRSIGLPLPRAKALLGISQAFAASQLDFPPGMPSSTIRERLLTLPGVGPWTAEYLLLRAWRDPDAFPVGDLALRKAAGNLTEKQLDARSQAWRPWRSYATMHLWQSLKL